MFKAFLTYKLTEQGKSLVVIDKWYPSSKTCHICGERNKELTLSDREWVLTIVDIELHNEVKIYTKDGLWH